jgi:hypothetical protein
MGSDFRANISLETEKNLPPHPSTQARAQTHKHRHTHTKLLRPTIIFFYYLVCETIGTAVTPGLLCQPRVIVKMIVEEMECRLAGET